MDALSLALLALLALAAVFFLGRLQAKAELGPQSGFDAWPYVCEPDCTSPRCPARIHNSHRGQIEPGGAAAPTVRAATT